MNAIKRKEKNSFTDRDRINTFIKRVPINIIPES